MSADMKYGEIYTEDEVVKIVQMAVEDAVISVARGENHEEVRERYTEGNIREVARTDIDRIFHPGEPLFILRGQDRRALGAIRFYREHQWPNATKEHLDSIDDAVELFEAYRKVGHMKEPD
jgi:histidinol phosphatase-like PHP family hydrolase